MSLETLRRWSGETDRVPVWAAGLLVALLGWRIEMGTPMPGLDPSWNAGLAMAVDDGLRFGRQVVFTYGPLGFLQGQMVWFSGLAVLAFLYNAGVYVLFCVGLVWALRRRLPLLVSAAVAFVLVAALLLLELGMLAAVFACVWLLEGERPPRAQNLFVAGAATFGAALALVKLSTGPLVAVLFLIALVGARAGWRRITAYLLLLAAELLALWLLSGQSLGDVPAFAEHTLQISSGYSTAMLRQTDVAAWKVLAATIAAAALGIAIAAVAWFGASRERARRWAAAAIAALAAFAVFKEGVVRTDAGHLTLFFANACVLWIAFGLGVPRWRWALVVAAAVALMTVPVRPHGIGTNFDAPANARLAFEGVRTLLSPSRRQHVIEDGHTGMRDTYQLEPRALADLRGHTVAVEPWEIGAAWAYELNWIPLPVFQNYQAYTSALDRLNAETVADPNGPERILRENQLQVHPEFATRDLDGRYPGWDPPEQARAVLCNFAPLTASERWQVLGRVRDRCGDPRPLGTVSAAPGEAVEVPAPGPRQVVFARIGGVGVGGLERLQTFLFHADARHLTVNGERRYRLIPETAGDGLILRAGAEVYEPGPFATVPQARTIAVEGAGEELTFDFYAMTVRPAPAAP